MNLKTNMNLVNLGKLPPHSGDAERAVIGAMLLEKDAILPVMDIIQSDDAFYEDEHRVIFKAIKSLYVNNKPIDLLTVKDELLTTGQLDNAGGVTYLVEMTGTVASGAHASFHARIIVERYLSREVIRISSALLRDGYDDTKDAFELLNDAELAIFKLGKFTVRNEVMPVLDILQKNIEKLKVLSTHEGTIYGVPSGFYQLDQLTGGFQSPDLIIIAARPAMGKSALMLNIARNIAIRFNRAIAVFSLEMSNEQLVNRLISSELAINSDLMRTGKLARHQWDAINSGLNSIRNSKMFFDDTPSITLPELRSKCRKLKSESNIELIIIDYLQLMRSGANKIVREQEVSAISAGLKALAKELNIPIIALAQLGRGVEASKDKVPKLSDLRESGSIEQDADIVMFVHRPEYYGVEIDEDGNSLKGIGQIIVAKHRNGGLATIKLNWIPEYVKFVESQSVKESYSPSTKFDGYDFDQDNISPF